MTTFRRIPKYTPAVLMGLLIAVWVATCFRGFGREYRSLSFVSYTWIQHGSLFSVGGPQISLASKYRWIRPKYQEPLALRTVLGGFDFQVQPYKPTWMVRIPIPFLTTALLPLAIGPFLSFRFRLWHYLAYTALVAVELAYYLRWQE